MLFTAQMYIYFAQLSRYAGRFFGFIQKRKIYSEFVILLTKLKYIFETEPLPAMAVLLV